MDLPELASSSDSTEAVQPDVDKQVEDDDRVVCSNNHSLDKIFKVAVENVTQLAKSNKLENCETQFVSRFSEVFKNTLQENVTINGLPWVLNKESLSTDQNERQKNETNIALFSKLSKMVEVLAHKRKFATVDCKRIYGILLKQERHNLKRTKIEHKEPLIPLTVKSTEVTGVSPKKLTEVCEELNSVSTEIQTQLGDLQRSRKNIEFANDIMKRQKPHLEVLYDTGYITE